MVHARAHDHDASNQTNINSTISYFGFEHSVNFIAPNRGALANSPVNADNLEMHLLGHPDRCQVNYVLSGFRQGFRIGFQPNVKKLKSASSNIIVHQPSNNLTLLTSI